MERLPPDESQEGHGEIPAASPPPPLPWNSLESSANPIQILESRALALGLAMAFAMPCVALWSLAAWALAPALDGQHPLAGSVFSLIVVAVPLTHLFLRLSGQRRWDEVGLPANRAGLCHLAAGVASGCGLAAVIVGVQWWAGWLVPVSGATLAGHGDWLWEPPLLLGVAVLAVGAAGEELLFRGYALQQLMRAATPWPAVIGTSALFGLLHFNNPDFSKVGMLNTMLFGGLFGVALVRHRSLWLAYGIHFGWNLTLALAGVNVSGLTIRLTELSFVPAGPSLWSGADYGPEGSLFTTFAVIGLGVGLWKVRLAADPSPKLWEAKPAASPGGGQS